MAMVEITVSRKYRIETFILPKTEEIKFFSEKINKSINFFKK